MEELVVDAKQLSLKDRVARFPCGMINHPMERFHH